jgi:hypothetical protein
MDDGGCLISRRNRFRVQGDVAKQQIRLGRLDIVGAVHFSGHVARKRQYGRVVAARFVETGDEMTGAGPSCAAANAELPGHWH